MPPPMVSVNHCCCPLFVQPAQQVSSRSAGPVICIWDSRVGSRPSSAPSPLVKAAAAAGSDAEPASEVARLQLDKELRGIVALGEL